MSQVIDEKVVEMRFDNKNFENNVKTSMNTLEKLKQCLNLKGASEGIENVNAAVKKFDMSGMTTGVESVRVKFSALEVAAMTAVSNITNSVLNMGKKLVSDFTIAPIKSGLEEYETQINAVQTILANTSASGTSLEQVNSALDELNKYADKTIYNFTEMTKNIATFTAAGIDLDTSVSAIQGIANVAAVSGSTSQQASTAMYQLSQALATGTVKLQDWNSVINAGMGGEVFQNALKETSRQLAKTSSDYTYDVDALIEENGSFRESLSEGWITSEVLTETLSKFTKSGVVDYIAEMTGASEDQVEQFQKLGDAADYSGTTVEEMALSLANGDETMAETITSTMKMATTAEDAATKVKTFTQLMDTLGEAVQSGWTQTWEIIIGDFEEAKSLWTGVSDTLSQIINDSAEARNAVLEEAMTSGWDKFTNALTEAGSSTEDLQAKLENLVGEDKVNDLVQEYGSLGEVFRQGALSSDTLKQALDDLTSSASDFSKVDSNYSIGSTGEGVKQIQEALVAAGFQGDMDLTSYADGVFGSRTESALKAFQEAKGLTVSGIVDDETLAALKEATATTTELTDNVYELADGVSKLGGRDYLIQGLTNAWEALLSVAQPIKEAFNEIFPAISGDGITNALQKFSEFTEGLKLSDEQAEKIKATFSGLFSVVNLLGKIVKTGVSIAFKGLKSILKGLNILILDITSSVGEALQQFIDWVDQNEFIEKGFGKISSAVESGVTQVEEWFEIFKDSGGVQNAMNNIEGAFFDAKNAVTEFVTKGSGPIADFGNTVKTKLSGAWKVVKNLAQEIWNLEEVQKVVTKIKETFSDGFSEIGDFFSGGIEKIQEFIERVKNLGQDITLDDIKNIFTDFKENVLDYFLTLGGKFESVGDALAVSKDKIVGWVSGIGEVMSDFVDNISGFAKEKLNVENISTFIKSVFGIFVLLKTFKGATELAKTFDAVTKPFRKVSEVLEELKSSIGKYTKAKSFESFGKGIQSIAIAIGVVVAAIYVLGKMDTDQLNQGLAAVSAVIAAVTSMGVILMAASKSFLADQEGISSFGKMLLELSASLLIIVAAMKIIAGMEWGDIGKAAVVLGGFTVGVVALMAATKLLRTESKNAEQVGKMMTKFATSMLILVAAIKILGNMDSGELIQGGVALGVMAVGIVGLMAATKLLGTESKNSDKVAKMISKFAASMLILVAAIKILGNMDSGELIQGGVALGVMTVGIVGLMAATKLLRTESKNAEQVGKMMTKFATSMLIMAAAMRIIGGMDTGDYIKGLAAVTAMSAILAGLMYMSKYASVGKETTTTLVPLVAAIAVMAAAMYALSTIDTTTLIGTATALAEVMAVFSLMMNQSKNTTGSLGSLIVLVAAIGVIGTVLYALASLSSSTEKVLGVATALSEVMIAMAATFKIISSSSSHWQASIAPLAIMVVAVAAIGTVLGILASTHPEGVLEIATAISEILLAVSAAALILSAAGSIGGVAVSGAASMAVLVGAIAGVILGVGALAGLLQENYGVMDTISAGLESIGEAFGSLIAGFGAGVTSTLPEIGENIKAFSDAISGVNSDGIDSAANLAKMLLSLTEATIIDGITDFLGLGDMSSFAEKAVSFADAMKQISSNLTGNEIDTTAIESVTAAGELFAALNEKLPRTGGLVQDIIGEQDMSAFGNKALAFTAAMIVIAGSVQTTEIDTAAIQSITEAGGLFADLSNALPTTGGLKSDIIGEQDMSDFGSKAVAFTLAMVTVSTSLKTVEIDTDSIQKVTDAGGLFAALNEALPSDGGVMGALFGDTMDLGEFGENIRVFAEAMSEASNTLTGDNKIDSAAITAASDAGLLMAALAEAIPENDGGWFKEDSFSNFSGNITEYGDAIVDFNDKVKDVKTADVQPGINLGYKMKALAEAFDGVDFSSIGYGLETIVNTIGGYIAQFYGQVRDVDDGNVDAVSKFNTFVKRISEIDLTQISSDDSAFEALGSGIKDCYDKISQITAEPFDIVSVAVDKMVEALAKISIADASNVASFIASVNKLGTINLDSTALESTASTVSSSVSSMMSSLNQSISSSGSSISTSFSGILSDMTTTISGNTTVSTAMKLLMAQAVQAIKNQASNIQTATELLVTTMVSVVEASSSNVNTAFGNAVSGGASAIRAYYTSFYYSGQYLIEGAINGISNKIPALQAAARSAASLANAAYAATAQINSPSKVWYSYGSYMIQGAVNGLTDGIQVLSETASQAGRTGNDAFSEAISAIDTVLASDADIQPRICPVVDLSNVQAGVNTMNGMLATNASVGVMANVRAIDWSSGIKNQNGDNSEIVSAIKSLGKNLNAGRGATYNLGGVTYDDGSNVSTAVKTLVRAVRMESRV